ncbi:TonB-dependent receptor [Pontibacter arcticus]|uniref:TonB-dependent receptor n=1 Tax=Pontibacter arcticus TaxID=2080288 RepID=A0A364RFP4_9BACT|nr:TonB-dependent receptor [Pontibacter arcticus]RAU83121.1 TonB-dependent receptor [Pontibacter arcticus]
MRKLLLLLALFASVFQLYAQTGTVTGTVKSLSDNSALPAASVVLTKTATATKTGVPTDLEGRFIFERVTPGSYTVEVNYIGFKKYTRSFEMTGATINLGTLSLEDESTAIKEVQVIGRAPLGEQKGDTSQFNAKAFKTAPDASAEDLVTKMPGVTITNGTIQAQGEDVRQIMIDGKRYTGQDVNAAVRNLSADMIESVQVFDGQSDQAAFSGFEDGNRLKTLNFTTKKEARQGYMGKVSAGYGTDDRYMVGAALNIFNNNQRITVTGLTNNINMFDFSVGETPGGGMRGRRGGWGGGSPNGIINTNTFGINYQDTWGKKMEVSGNYNYSNRDIVNNQYRFRDFVNSDTTYTENSINRSTDESHRLNFRLQYNINANNRLLVTPSITVQRNDGLTERDANTIGNGTIALNSLNSNRFDNASLNFNNNILYSHRFGSSGRILTASLNTSYNDSDGDSYQRENTDNIGRPERNVLRNQYTSTDRTNMAWSGNLNYSQKLGEKSRWQVEYNINNQENDSDRRANDIEEDNTLVPNPQLSNTFTSNYLAQNFGPSYQYRTEKVRFQANARYQYATLESENTYPTTFPLKRNFTNFLPSAEYEFKFSESTNLNINYRAATNVPSVEQLQDVLDISNPLQPSIGNSRLDQDYDNRLRVRFRKFNAETNRVFFIGVFGNMTQNYIANSIYTAGSVPADLPADYQLQSGARLSRPVNMDGYWNVRSFFHFGQPLNVISSNIGINGSVGYSRIPGMINEVVNYANNINYGIGANISSNISEKIDFTVSTNSSYTVVENTLSTNQNNNFFSQNTNLRYNWILWKGLVYRTELQHQYNSGLSAGVDNSYLLWNMSIGKKVFKNQQGEISLSVNDLLKQNVSVQRNVTESYVEDVQSTVLQRFFMLTFSYNIRKFNGGAAPTMNNNRPGNWGGGRN